MKSSRIRSLSRRVEQLELALRNAVQLIAQLDIIQFSTGEVLLEKKVYAKAEVAVIIKKELERRVGSKSTDIKQDTKAPVDNHIKESKDGRPKETGSDRAEGSGADAPKETVQQEAKD